MSNVILLNLSTKIRKKNVFRKNHLTAPVVHVHSIPIFTYFCTNIFQFMTKQPNHKISNFLKVEARVLMFIAASVWMFAGLMLITRGLTGVTNTGSLLLKLGLCVSGGILFYVFMFSKISLKHIRRIKSLNGTRVFFFQFFNIRSFIMMFSMISLGVTLRLTGLVPFKYLALFYIVMGTPLLISSFRFLKSAIRFHQI